jgi:hypothetical protein
MKQETVRSNFIFVTGTQKKPGERKQETTIHDDDFTLDMPFVLLSPSSLFTIHPLANPN